jgi:putative redox protein
MDARRFRPADASISFNCNEERGIGMIRATSKEENFLTEYTDGDHTAFSDAPENHGGAGANFSPSALLEAALANCMNITARVYAQSHGLSLGEVETTVNLDRGQAGSTMEYQIKWSEPLTADQEKRLHAALGGCPIHGILSHPVAFKLKQD